MHRLYEKMDLQVIIQQSEVEVYKAILFLNLCLDTNNLRYVSSTSEHFYILTPVQISNDL